ncbi:MAG: hypothetical protein BZ151_02550 [Desulfobacca sp. 4484_104]|nr:MAG: hypothetical protein BZ151_02550 [Desulfobacca sp. 4484_104]RLA90491.1 MAG: hypothetical protein DRG58_02105 [Deltaproteobacteria bacterium]
MNQPAAGLELRDLTIKIETVAAFNLKNRLVRQKVVDTRHDKREYSHGHVKTTNNRVRPLVGLRSKTSLEKYHSILKL